MLQETPTIPCEMQTSETHKRTNSLQWNSRKEDYQIENVNSQVEFRQRSQESEPQQKVALKSIGLMRQHDSNDLIYEEEQ